MSEVPKKVCATNIRILRYLGGLKQKGQSKYTAVKKGASGTRAVTTPEGLLPVAVQSTRRILKRSLAFSSWDGSCATEAFFLR